MRLAMSVILGLFLLLPGGQNVTPSALESNSAGWKDLFADRSMTQWARGPLMLTIASPR